MHLTKDSVFHARFESVGGDALDMVTKQVTCDMSYYTALLLSLLSIAIFLWITN